MAGMDNTSMAGAAGMASDQELIDQMLAGGALSEDDWEEPDSPVRTVSSMAPAPGIDASSLLEPSTPGLAGAGVRGVQFMPLVEQPPLSESNHGIDLLLDVQLEVSVELGKARMPISDILALRTGSVIELDKLAGEPVDVFVNGTLVARGEVVVVDEKFGVRITEVVSKAGRLASLS